MTDDQHKKQFLRADEVNGLYGIKAEELQALVDRGILRALRDQGSFKYRRDEIEMLIEQGQVKPLSDTVPNAGLFSGSTPIIPAVDSDDDWGIAEAVGSIAPAPNAEMEIPVLELAADDELVAMPVEEAEEVLPIGEIGEIASDVVLGKSSFGVAAKSSVDQTPDSDKTPDTVEIPSFQMNKRDNSDQDSGDDVQVYLDRPDSDSDVRIDLENSLSDSDVRIVSPELAQAMKAAAAKLDQSDSDVRLELPKTPSDSDIQLHSPAAPSPVKSGSDSDVRMVAPEIVPAAAIDHPKDSKSAPKPVLSDSDSDVRFAVPAAPISESDIIIEPPRVESLLGEDADLPETVATGSSLMPSSMPTAESEFDVAGNVLTPPYGFVLPAETETLPSSSASSSRIEAARAEIEQIVGDSGEVAAGEELILSGEAIEATLSSEPASVSPENISAASGGRIEMAQADMELILGAENEALTSGTWLPPESKTVSYLGNEATASSETADAESLPPAGLPSAASMSAASSGRIEMAKEEMGKLLGEETALTSSSGSWMSPAVAPHELFPTSHDGSSDALLQASKDIEALSGVEARKSDPWLELPPRSPAELMEGSQVVYGNDSDSTADTAVRTKSEGEYVLEGFEPNAEIPSHVMDPSESGISLEASDSALYRREMLNENSDIRMSSMADEEITLVPGDDADLQLHADESGVSSPSSFAGRPIDSGISFDVPDLATPYSSGLLDDSMESGIRLQPVDSGLDLDSGESGIRLHADSGLALESQVGRRQGDSGLALGNESGLALDQDSGLALGRDSGIALGRDSGIALGRDSGLALSAAEESGLSLEKAGRGSADLRRGRTSLTEEIVLGEAGQEAIELADLAHGQPVNLQIGPTGEFDDSEDTAVRPRTREQGVLSTAFEMGDEVGELEVDESLDTMDADSFVGDDAFDTSYEVDASEFGSADELEEVHDELVEADDEDFTEGVASAEELELAPMAAASIRRGPAWPFYQTLMIVGASVMLTINGVLATAALGSMWSGSPVASYAAGLVSALGNIL